MADSRTKRYSKPFNVMLDETHRAMLDQVAHRRAVPAAQVIRDMIDKAYRMEFANEPRCASGEGCLCPQAHYGRRPAPESSEDILKRQRSGNGEAPQQPLP